MSRLVETVKIENGKLLNLSFHNERMSEALYDLFKIRRKIDLEESIIVPEYAIHGIFKCRVVYDENSTEVEYIPYTIRHIRSLKLVKDDEINYSYKFADRSIINKLMELRGSCDDILIIKNGMVTDSSYSNVLFRDSSGNWFTPSSYLLPGTMRASLLQNNRVKEAKISVTDIQNYIEVRLINAMKGLEDSESIPVSEIFA